MWACSIYICILLVLYIAGRSMSRYKETGLIYADTPPNNTCLVHVPEVPALRKTIGLGTKSKPFTNMYIVAFEPINMCAAERNLFTNIFCIIADEFNSEFDVLYIE